MILALALTCSILLLVLQLLGFPSAVRYPIDLGKFAYRKQMLVIVVADVLFVAGILIAYLLKPTAELLICILPFIQMAVGFIYIEVLSIFCKRKFLRDIAEEIKRLNLDTSEDLIVIRRQFMENSEISCSLKELQKAIDLINKSIA